MGFTENLAPANRAVGMHYAGVSWSISCMEIRWLAGIIHGFCGVVNGSDDLETIWR